MLLFGLPGLRCRVGAFGVLPGKAIYLVSIILQGIGRLTEGLSKASPERRRREPVLLIVRRREACFAASVEEAMLVRPEDPASEGLGYNKFVTFNTSGCPADAGWRCRVGDLVEP